MTPNLKLNIIANYAGSFWSALMGLAFVPLYIKFMGMEAYGLVGFFGTLLSLFSILDMGLSPTLGREIARRSALANTAETIRDLLRTIETIYWGMAVIIGAAVILLSFPIAKYWVNPEKLTINDVQQAVMIMGLVVVLRWPFGMYQGGLMGLQRQVLVNIITAISATLRGLGAVLILIMVSSTIQAFFVWQIVVSGAETFTMAACLWHFLPKKNQKATFKKEILREVWRFAGGMMGISLAAGLLQHTDKILLSRLIPLEMYGYYTLAWSVAGMLYRIVVPAVMATYPEFVQLVARGDAAGTVAFYHKSCQFMSAMILPVAMVLVFFSYSLLFTWTGDANIAEKTHVVLSLLVIGTAFNAMMNMPFAIQLAYGWTSLTFWVNVFSILVWAPLLIVMVTSYGMIGGAVSWIFLNIGYVLFGLPLMHRRILHKELLRWYVEDFGTPALIAIGLGLVGWIVIPQQLPVISQIFFLGCLTVVIFLGVILVTPDIRMVMLLRIWAFSAGWKKRIFQASN